MRRRVSKALSPTFVCLAFVAATYAERYDVGLATTKDILDLLRSQEVVPKPKKPSSIPIRDPDDAWVLASAIDGRCDVLVTGDRDLLDIAGSAQLPILNPRGFWEFVRKPPV